MRIVREMGDARLAEIEALYRNEHSRFLRVATAVLRDEERAVDVVQEAFATAVQKRHRFRGDGPLEAWVWRIVMNAALKERGRPQSVELKDVALVAETEPTSIGEAVARLPERQRLALFLRYYADLDYGSIAVALGISVGTVGAMLNAAHAGLRRLLQEARP